MYCIQLVCNSKVLDVYAMLLPVESQKKEEKALEMPDHAAIRDWTREGDFLACLGTKCFATLVLGNFCNLSTIHSQLLCENVLQLLRSFFMLWQRNLVLFRPMTPLLIATKHSIKQFLGKEGQKNNACIAGPMA